MDKLKSPATLAAAMASILLFNIRHMVQAYEAITGSTSLWYDVAALVALDFTIFLFALHGKRIASLGFSLAVAVVNITHLTAGPGIDNWQEVVVAWVFGLAYSAGIYIFSELFVSITTGQAEAEILYTEAERQAYAVEYAAGFALELDTLQRETDQARAQVETAARLLAALTYHDTLEREYHRLRAKETRGTLNGESAAYELIRAARKARAQVSPETLPADEPGV